MVILSSQGIEFDAEAATLEDQFGAPRGEPGQWAACLRIVDPASLSTVFVQELDNNEAITSMSIVQFAPAAVQVGGCVCAKGEGGAVGRGVLQRESP